MDRYKKTARHTKCDGRLSFRGSVSGSAEHVDQDAGGDSGTDNTGNVGTMFFAVGFSVMMVLDVALG